MLMMHDDRLEAVQGRACCQLFIHLSLLGLHPGCKPRKQLSFDAHCILRRQLQNLSCYFWFPIYFRVLNFAVLDSLLFIAETKEHTHETLLGFGINSIVWVCRMIFVSGFTTVTMLPVNRCRKQLQSSLTRSINSIFFLTKKPHTWSLKGFGFFVLFFVWFFSEGLCTLAGLQMSQRGHSVLSVTLYKKVLVSWGNCIFRKVWQRVTAAGGCSPPVTQHWIVPTG